MLSCQLCHRALLCMRKGNSLLFGMEDLYKASSLIAFCYIFILTIVLPSCSGLTCKKTGICSCEMSDGSGTIDLHAISSTSNSPSFTEIRDAEGRTFFYNYNPCKAFTMGTCKNVLVCQVYNSGTSRKLYYDIGSTMKVNYETSTKSFQFVYDSADNQKKTFITLKCDAKSSTSTLDDFKEDPTGSGKYKTTLTSKYACPSKTSSSKKKISTGTILCILLLVGLVLYFAIGIVFLKYHQKKEGSEVIPNIGFWKDLPSLVKDGCLFTWMKVRRKQSEYEKI